MEQTLGIPIKTKAHNKGSMMLQGVVLAATDLEENDNENDGDESDDDEEPIEDSEENGDGGSNGE